MSQSRNLGNLGDLLQANSSFVAQDSSTGAATIPSGNTSQRPTTTANGQIRFNNLINSYEGYIGASNSWGSFVVTTANVSVVFKDSSTGAANIPAGTTAQRPSVAANGQIRFNTDIKSYEGYNGALGLWASIGGGATGGGTDKVFYENNQVVTTNYTITANTNAMSAGPITINDGVSITIPDNQNWTVV